MGIKKSLEDKLNNDKRLKIARYNRWCKKAAHGPVRNI